MQKSDVAPRSEAGTGTTTCQIENHKISLAAWDVPTPVEEKHGIRIKVGATCDHGCSLSGSVIEVKEANGKTISSGTLGGVPFVGTRSLFWAEVDFGAPGDLGLHTWEARVSHSNAPPSHTSATVRFSVLVTKSAQYRLTVSVSDGATKAPLGSAYVRVGGSTLFTDDSGKAAASVAPGIQELVAWKRDHLMSRSKVDVSKDDVIQVELTPYPCKYCPDRTG